jgi:hypothetical protein
MTVIMGRLVALGHFVVRKMSGILFLKKFPEIYTRY